MNLDEQPIADAIKAAIQVELGVHATAYEVDEIPGTRGTNPAGAVPQRHVDFELNRVDAFPSRRASGEVTVPDRELVTRCHAENVGSVRELQRRVALALEDRAYALPDGGTVGPFRFAIAEPIEADDSGAVGALHWTFA